MKRRRIVAGNWKMNKDFESGLSLAAEIIPMVVDELQHEVETIIIPPFIHLHAVASLAAPHKHIAVGGQDCSRHTAGAYTGEIAAEMLKSAGADYVLVGHSERRQYHGETNAICLEKIVRALEAGLHPIYCIGELKEERVEERYEGVIQDQLAGALLGLSPGQMKHLIIAYEPVWAIGTGVTASDEQAQEAHAFIRGLLQGLYNQDVAEATRILYGGSVKPNNVDGLMAQTDIDGALVGGASLKAEDFIRIVRFE
jgi:triosephosphate isomerase